MLPTLSMSGDLVMHARLPFLRFLSTMPWASDDLRDRYPSQKPGLPSAKRDPSLGLGIRLGDVVVAVSPNDPLRTVCKRVLGMPGDTVLLDPREGMDGTDAAASLHDPALATMIRMQTARTVTVPPGHVWLAGDNLANSTDSRHYGPVPLALVRGRVLARLYPSPRWLSGGLQRLPPISIDRS